MGDRERATFLFSIHIHPTRRDVAVVEGGAVRRIQLRKTESIHARCVLDLREHIQTPAVDYRRAGDPQRLDIAAGKVARARPAERDPPELSAGDGVEVVHRIVLGRNDDVLTVHQGLSVQSAVEWARRPRAAEA